MRGLLLLWFLQQMAPIKVDVNLVNVGFTVRDARGALAPGLSKDDFDVLEDGVPQKISFFGRSTEVPLTLGLIVDVSGSQQSFVKAHHRDLDAFLREAVGPRDRAFLICFGNRLRLVSDFANSRPELLERLKRFEKGDRGFPELGPAEMRILGTAFYDALFYSATEKLAGGTEQGRKALIVFSDGEDNSSAHHMMDTIEAAQIADARIYAIRYTESRHGRWNARNKYGMRVMERIARDTGAADFDAEKGEMRAFFRQIAEELRSSYELAYTSTNPERDGTFRKVVIRPHAAGLTVRAKTGYFAR